MRIHTRRMLQGRGNSRLARWLLFLGALLIGATPLTAAGSSIYESAGAGPLAVKADPPPVIVGDQCLGVKFYVHAPVTTGSVGGYLAPYGVGVESEIVGSIVKLDGPHDFPDSFDLTGNDVLGRTPIRVSEPAGDFAGDLAVTLTEGWYALVFSATGLKDANNAIMPRMNKSIEHPLYFFGRALDPKTPAWFAYFDGGGLDGVRMFVSTDPVPPAPDFPTVLLGSGPDVLRPATR